MDINLNVAIKATPEFTELISCVIDILKGKDGGTSSEAETTNEAAAPVVPVAPRKRTTTKKDTPPAPVVATIPEDNDDFLNDGSETPAAETLTLETIRAKATEKSVNDNKRTEVRALLAKYKAENLGGVKKEDYQKFYDELVNL